MLIDYALEALSEPEKVISNRVAIVTITTDPVVIKPVY